jgi:hypothetical protein
MVKKGRRKGVEIEQCHISTLLKLVYKGRLEILGLSSLSVAGSNLSVFADECVEQLEQRSHQRLCNYSTYGAKLKFSLIIYFSSEDSPVLAVFRHD